MEEYKDLDLTIAVFTAILDKEHLRGLEAGIVLQAYLPDALGAYQRARAALVDGLGLEPGRELREMESAILVQEPDLNWVEPRPITADEVARVLRTANRAEPDLDVVKAVAEDAQVSARRAEESLAHMHPGAGGAETVARR